LVLSQKTVPALKGDSNLADRTLPWGASATIAPRAVPRDPRRRRSLLRGSSPAAGRQYRGRGTPMSRANAGSPWVPVIPTRFRATYSGHAPGCPTAYRRDHRCDERVVTGAGDDHPRGVGGGLLQCTLHLVLGTCALSGRLLGAGNALFYFPPTFSRVPGAWRRRESYQPVLNRLNRTNPNDTTVVPTDIRRP